MWMGFSFSFEFFFKCLENWIDNNSFSSSNQISPLTACCPGRTSSQPNPFLHSSCSIIFMRIMYGGKNPNGSNKAVIFFNSKRFVYPVPSSSEIDSYVYTSSFAFQMIPNVLMAISQSLNLYFLHDQLLLWSVIELRNYFLAYIPADYQSFDSSWYDLITVLSSVTESIVLSMYVDYNTLLDPIGSVCLFFGMLSGDKLSFKWWRINTKYHPVELENVWLVLRLGSKFLHNIHWYFQSSEWIPILNYISAITQTQAAGCLLNHKSTFIWSCCNFRSWWIALSDVQLSFADPSKTILTLVVDVSGRSTEKCDRNQPSFVPSLSTLCRYRFFKYWAIISYFFPGSGFLIITFMCWLSDSKPSNSYCQLVRLSSMEFRSRIFHLCVLVIYSLFAMLQYQLDSVFLDHLGGCHLPVHITF